jgi:raffinose/stachyose/melibiose transport system permease protein
MEAMLRNKAVILLFMAPAAVLYLLIVLVPIVLSVSYSFFSWDLIHPMRFVGLQNFTRMLTRDDVFPVAVRNAVFFMLTSIVLQTSIGYLLALLVTSRVTAKSFFKNVLFLPAVIPGVAVGLLWSLVYRPDIGIVNVMLKGVGLGALARPWLLQQPTALWAITLTTAWQYTGYAMIVFVAGIQSIPPAIFEAARIDGAGSFRTMRSVTIPLTRQVLRVEVVLIAIGSLKIFDLIYVMTQGGPVHATEVLATYLYRRAFFQFEYGYGDALSVVLLLMCLVVTVLINRMLRAPDVEY